MLFRSSVDDKTSLRSTDEILRPKQARARATKQQGSDNSSMPVGCPRCQTGFKTCWRNYGVGVGGVTGSTGAGTSGGGGVGSTLAGQVDHKNQPLSSGSPIWRLIAALCLVNPLFLLTLTTDGAGVAGAAGCGGCCCCANSTPLIVRREIANPRTILISDQSPIV